MAVERATAQPPAAPAIAPRGPMEWISKTLRLKRPAGHIGFATVFGRELRAIRARREALGVLGRRPLEIDDAQLAENAWHGRLLGVSFSGGGIRSATFNLGVLQALASFGLLRHVDYLSTVSGGGYIGSWLTALSQRAFARRCEVDGKEQKTLEPRLPLDKDHYRQFERELAWSAGGERDKQHDPADTREARAIRFLREYSNYLTPKLGVFSADTWALISIYIRNALLNQLVLVFAIVFLLLIPRFLSAWLARDPITPDSVHLRFGLPALEVWAVVVALGAAIVAWNLGRNLAGISDSSRATPNPPSSLGVIGWMLGPMLVIGIGAAEWMPLLSRELAGGVRGWSTAAGLGAVVSTLLWLAAWGAALVSPWPQARQHKFWWRMLVFAPVSGVLFGVGIHAAGGMLAALPPYSGFSIIVSVPLLALGILTAGVLHVGLAGKSFSSQYTEWLSRFGGLALIGALGWLGLTALVFLGPFLIALLPGYLDAALASGWAATTLSAVIFGRSKATSSASVLRPVLTTVAPWIFIVGLLLLLAAVVQKLLLWGATLAFPDVGAELAIAPGEWRTAAAWTRYAEWLTAPEIVGFVAVAGIGALTIALLLSRRIDINTFSLNSMYGNRLVRCYLGASVERRWANPFSGLSGRDDLSLFAVAQDTGTGQPVYAHAGVDGLVPGKIDAPDLDKTAYPGPYHLVNTAINLVAGRSLAWQERKAASFVLSPLYCGYRQLTARDEEPKLVDAYRSSREFSSEPKCLTLGEAMATSGAAASPNMGHHSSPAFAFLMGVFNIRLGRWVGNPAPTGKEMEKEVWKTTGPGIALWHLLREVLGLTNSDSDYVYLSDGGHFENLGLYELVRRRCRYIVACDAGADPQYGFEDLANAIRKCRVDLGVEIDLDVKEIAAIDAGYNGAPCALGNIRYSGQEVGTLLYIKACRRQGFPSDIMNYATEHPTFPHETTADQFFSESQFESYRRLGSFLTTQILGSAVAEASDDPVTGAAASEVDVPKLFRCLRQNWHRSSLSVSTHFGALARAIDELFERQRTSPELAFLNRQFYPEWRELMQEPRRAEEQADDMWEVPTDPQRLQQAFYFCNSLIQLMEAVYVDLDLESEWNHPDSSGWMNLFNHWTWSGMFRVTWAVSAAQYGRRFRSFCRQRLKLELGNVFVDPVFTGGAAATRASFEQALAGSGLNLLEQEQVKSLSAGLAPAALSLCRLELRVEIKLVEDQPARVLRSFVFGYALLSGDELLMFRVQDHLRAMDLGRQGLTRLVALRRPARIRIGDNASVVARLKTMKERAEHARINEFRAMLASIHEDG